MFDFNGENLKVGDKFGLSNVFESKRKEKKTQYLKSGLRDIQYIIWIIHTVIAVIIKRISRVRI